MRLLLSRSCQSSPCDFLSTAADASLMLCDYGFRFQAVVYFLRQAVLFMCVANATVLCLPSSCSLTVAEPIRSAAAKGSAFFFREDPCICCFHPSSCTVRSLLLLSESNCAYLRPISCRNPFHCCRCYAFAINLRSARWLSSATFKATRVACPAVLMQLTTTSFAASLLILPQKQHPF